MNHLMINIRGKVSGEELSSAGKLGISHGKPGKASLPASWWPQVSVNGVN